MDDEAPAAARLGHLCARLDGVEVAGIASDGLAALSLVTKLRPNVILLDISMPEMNGVAVARTLITHEPRPAIIFVTAHSGYAVAAFELAATDYLLKPVSLARLSQAITRVQTVSATPSAHPASHLTEIWVPRGRDMVRVDTGILDLLEAERDYVRLHAGGQSYLLRTTLKDLEYRLDPSRFVRVHRSAIVAVDRIGRVQRGLAGRWTVILSSGASVRVGRSFQQSIRKLATRMDKSAHVTARKT